MKNNLICKNYDECDMSYKNCTISCENFRGDDYVKYHCTGCDIILEDDELTTYRDSRGYYGSEPVYESYEGCPQCGGGVDETIKCERCQEYYPEHSTRNGICHYCLTEITQNDVTLSEYVKTDIDAFIEWWKENGDLYG